jgi:hypothetical protein
MQLLQKLQARKQCFGMVARRLVYPARKIVPRVRRNKSSEWDRLCHRFSSLFISMDLH